MAAAIERFENGAAIAAERNARGHLRYAVFSPGGGEAVRRMRDLEAARAFAASLPVPADMEPLPPAPRPLSLSPRAHARRAELRLDGNGEAERYVPAGKPIEETDAVFDKMRGAQVRSEYEDSLALSRRQSAAHEAVYYKRGRR
jgi:hypothetical protein